MMFRVSNPTRVLKALWLSVSLLMVVACASTAPAQTAAFTYQGRLTDSATPANGNYDLQFALFDAVSGGAQVGTTRTVLNVSVSAGIFSVQLDFGANAFPGANRFLEIGAKLPGGAAFTTLSPRQPITSTPYAVRSLNASSADSVPVSALPAGNGNYIQNTSSTQVSSNFNISGNGTAGGTLTGNVVNANTQYNIGGNRVLSTPGFNNTFAGKSAGENTFFNAQSNSFFGWSAGMLNTTGESNAFFGTSAGFSNGTGKDNSFFGAFAGATASHSAKNSFFGNQAGGNNTFGGENSFFGSFAGLKNTIGTYNTFIGASSGSTNTVEDYNTFVGGFSDGTAGITNATAIGSRARVTQSNSLVLGSISAGFTPDTKVGIGTTAPARKLHLSGVGSDGAGQTDLRITGTGTIASGITLESTGAGGRTYSWLSTADNTGGGGSGPGRLAVFDVTAGAYRMVIDGTGQVGIGTFSPDRTLSVNGNASKTGGGSWESFSDERLKNITGRFTPGLKAVMQLQPLRFEYKRDNALGLKTDGEHVGFGAQAVEKIIPEAVSKNDKGYLLVNNDPILWTMLNAIKEQQAQIETLRTSNAVLQSRLRTVEKQLRKRVGPRRRR